MLPDGPRLLEWLTWCMFLLFGAVVLLVLMSIWMQWRSDRRNHLRIACFQQWETALPDYLFQSATIPKSFLVLSRDRQDLLRIFLRRFLASIGGEEAGKLKELYFAAKLDQGVEGRVRHRSAKERALAALEIGMFGLEEYLPTLLPLLEDPAIFVAHAAARSLSRSRNLDFAQPVLQWVLGQDRYQMERLVNILEAFGQPIVPWLEDRLGPPEKDPLGWRLYCQLAASFRRQESDALLQGLLRVENREVRSSAIRALQVLGNPAAYASVRPFALDADPLLRMQAARTLGTLGGLQAIPELLRLLTDPFYDVRRHASLGLAALGGAGVEALRWEAQSELADLFARDMAGERLEWLERKGRL